MSCSLGHENPPNMAFCGQCGERLRDPTDFGGSALGPTTTPPSEWGRVGPGLVSDESDSGLDPFSTGPERERPWKRATRSRVVIGFLIVTVIAAGVLFVVMTRSSDSMTPIEEAAEKCRTTKNIGDEGTSISFDTKGEKDFSGDDMTKVLCVLDALDAPDRVTARMGQTRALDGTLDAAWDSYEAFWNYHPNSGMSLTIHVAE